MDNPTRSAPAPPDPIRSILRLINPQDYGELAQRTQEVKRLLGGFLGKLNAES